MDKVQELAKSVAEGGFSWVEDGNKILAIIDAVNSTFSDILPLDERREVCYTVLDCLDTEHDWDAPRMSEEVERGFYKMMIQWRVTS